MRIRKRGRVWWCWFYDREGNRIEESTRCTDRKAADEYQRRREREALDPDHAAAASATLTQALALLVRDRESKAAARPPKASAATVQFYREKSGHWRRILGDGFPLATLGSEHVDDYVRQRRLEGAAENTIAKELVALRAALKLAVRARIWKGNAAAVLPVGFAPEYKPRQRWAKVDELQRLLAAFSTPDHAARIAFIVATSAEWGATVRARREDVTDTSVHVRGTKRASRDRDVPLVTEWQRSLVRYALDRAEGEGGLLFRPWANANRDIKAACRRAGCLLTRCNGEKIGRKVKCTRDDCKAAQIPPLTANDLRRTCAQWLRRDGAPIELLAPVLGHSTTKMVQLVYGRLDAEGLASLLSAAVGDCRTIVADSSGLDGLSGATGPAVPRETAGNEGPEGGLCGE